MSIHISPDRKLIPDAGSPVKSQMAIALLGGSNKVLGDANDAAFAYDLNNPNNPSAKLMRDVFAEVGAGNLVMPKRPA